MNPRAILIPATLVILIALTLFLGSELDMYWGIISLVFLLVFLLEFMLLFESTPTGSKEVAFVAILGAISAASRIPFAGVPSIQPSTFIIMVTGAVFGAYAGFMVGMETALLSNFFLGQGPWTPWQMLAWGLAGIVGSLLHRWVTRRNFPYVIMVASFLYAYVYGIIMNLWYWLAFVFPHTWQSFLAVWSLSIYFDTLHAIGNVIFADLFAMQLVKILNRYRTRFSLFSDTTRHAWNCIGKKIINNAVDK